MLGNIKKNLFILYKHHNIILIQLFSVILYLLFAFNNKYDITNLFFTITGSVNCYRNFITICIVLIINFSFILFNNYIFNYDLKNNFECIFLRISKDNWIKSFIVSNFIVDTFIILLYYCLCYFLCGKINFVFCIVIIFSKIIIQMINLILYILLKNNSILLIGLWFILDFFINEYSVIYIYNLCNNSLLLYLVFAQLLIIFMLYILIKIIFNNMFNLKEKRNYDRN